MKVLILGGTGGIGREIANSLIERRYNVILQGRLNLSDYKVIKCNFLNSNELDAFLDEVRRLKIDILINSLGINHIDKFENISDKKISEIYYINLLVPALVTKAVIPYMKRTRYGRIIHIASVLAHRPFGQGRVPYSSSKAGLVRLVKSLALELAPYNVLINSISPATVDVGMTIKLLCANEKKAIKDKIPTHKFIDVKEIVKIVNLLIDSESITGADIRIDGGLSC